MSTSTSRRHLLTVPVLMLLSLGVGPGRADAGLGIVITDTILMPVGDPLTQYDFKLSLVAGNQIVQGDNITLLNVPDFGGAASYQFMSGGFNYANFFSIRTSMSSSTGLTNIALVLTAPPPASLTNPDPVNNLAIGDLIVATTVDFPPASGSPLFNPIAYTTQTHTYPGGVLNQGAGVTTADAIVPEPPSWALLGGGLAVAAGLGLARGRRRRPAGAV